LRSFQNLRLDSIWLEVDVKVPFLNLFGVGDHAVQLLDASDPLRRLLEEALSDVSHHPLVLSDLSRDSDEGAQLWWEVDVLPLLTDFKQWLVHRVDLDAVSGLEVVYHVSSGLLVAVVEDVVLRVHAPLDLVHLVGSVRAVLGHDDGTFELSVDEIGVMSHSSVSD
jgi:hypothetical protein